MHFYCSYLFCNTDKKRNEDATFQDWFERFCFLRNVFYGLFL